MDIVYRVGGDGYDGVLFAKRESAERVAQIRGALFSSTTWSDLRRSLPEGEWEDHFETFFHEWEQSDDGLFDPDCAPGVEDGDYPEWLLRSMLDWFPAELIQKYGGSLRRTTLNGDALELPADKAEEIAAELRAMGHSVEQTDLDIA